MDTRNPTQPVILNVYDLFWTNQYTSTIGLGIFHSGVEIFGTEFSYGGHPFEFSGIFEITPKDSDELGEHYKYKESVLLGHTSYTKEEVDQAIAHLGSSFKGSKYHLMQRNCNHFASELSVLLTGKEIPLWVNRLAYVGTCVPFLEKFLPKEWLTPMALEENVTNHQKSSTTSSQNSTNPNQNGGSAVPSNSFTSLLFARKSSSQDLRPS